MLFTLFFSCIEIVGVIFCYLQTLSLEQMGEKRIFNVSDRARFVWDRGLKKSWELLTIVTCEHAYNE